MTIKLKKNSLEILENVSNSNGEVNYEKLVNQLIENPDLVLLEIEEYVSQLIAECSTKRQKDRLSSFFKRQVELYQEDRVTLKFIVQSNDGYSSIFYYPKRWEIDEEWRKHFKDISNRLMLLEDIVKSFVSVCETKNHLKAAEAKLKETRDLINQNDIIGV